MHRQWGWTGVGQATLVLVTWSHRVLCVWGRVLEVIVKMAYDLGQRKPNDCLEELDHGTSAI